MMGKIPYCGKEVRQKYDYTRWTDDMLDTARRMKADGISNDDIADELGVTVGSVLNALARHRGEVAA
jgi:hypothetical protein